MGLFKAEAEKGSKKKRRNNIHSSPTHPPLLCVCSLFPASLFRHVSHRFRNGTKCLKEKTMRKTTIQFVPICSLFDFMVINTGSVLHLFAKRYFYLQFFQFYLYYLVVLLLLLPLPVHGSNTAHGNTNMRDALKIISNDYNKYSLNADDDGSASRGRKHRQRRRRKKTNAKC